MPYRRRSPRTARRPPRRRLLHNRISQGISLGVSAQGIFDLTLNMPVANINGARLFMLDITFQFQPNAVNQTNSWLFGLTIVTGDALSSTSVPDPDDDVDYSWMRYAGRTFRRESGGPAQDYYRLRGRFNRSLGSDRVPVAIIDNQTGSGGTLLVNADGVAIYSL